jgi:hypothetical protein
MKGAAPNLSPSRSRSRPALVFIVAAVSLAKAAAPLLTPDAAARELENIRGRLAQEREQFLMETAALGGLAKALDDQDPAGRQAAELKSMIVALLEERRKGTAPLELRTALLAEQLDRYKKTGVFSPTPPAAVANLKQLLDAPWAVWAGRKPVASLSLDLAQLQKELSHWQRSPESFPAPEKRPVPTVAAVPASAGYVRDRGAGKAEGDPVPELIIQLSSPEARRRALAADALAGRGVAARPAVAALTRALSDRDGRVRASSALALAAVGNLPADAAAGLRHALNDKHAEVRLSARLALRRLKGPASTPGGE